jgi:hypothetical protein
MDDKEEKPAEIVVHKADKIERLQEIENSLREQSFEIVSATIGFADIAQDEEDVPPEWVDELGYAGALRRFRIAKAGWLGAKEAPIGIKVAASICGNIIKARAAEYGKQPLNLTLVKVTSNLPNYKTIEVDE